MAAKSGSAFLSSFLQQAVPRGCEATVQSLLDMAVSNDFSEDYSDPHSDCYTEEIALGWRLPADDLAEATLVDFTNGITGFLSVLENDAGYDDRYMALVAQTLRELCDR